MGGREGDLGRIGAMAEKREDGGMEDVGHLLLEWSIV